MSYYQGKLSTSKAEKLYNVLRKTISNNINRKHTWKIRRLPVLSKQQEEAFKDYVIPMSEFGFPFDTSESYIWMDTFEWLWYKEWL